MLDVKDTTKSFIISKMLFGMEKINKHIDARKPITLELLHNIIAVLKHVCNSSFESKLFAACFSLAFFGFLRVGEFALSANSEHHLIGIQDVVISPQNEIMSLTVPSSKTDQFANSTKLKIFPCSDQMICPVRNMKYYLLERPKINGSLFCHLDHKLLTRLQVSTVLKAAIKFLNLNPDDYNTHSFRIGAATSFSQLGKSDDEIKKLGRWKSGTFSRYIRI